MEEKIKIFYRNVSNSNELNELFNPIYQQILDLFEKEQNMRGNILQFHLIVEHFLNEYIKDNYENVTDLNQLLNLNFYKKLSLLKKPNNDEIFLNALKEFNSIRNNYSHDINFLINKSHLSNIIFHLNRCSFKEEIKKDETIISILSGFIFNACGFIFIQNKNIKSKMLKVLEQKIQNDFEKFR